MVAGGRVTGQAVAAVLTRFGATPTVCDDDPVMLRPHAERGLPTVSSSDAVQQITGYALVVASPGFSPATRYWPRPRRRGCRSGVTWS